MTVNEFMKNTNISGIYKLFVDDGTKTAFEYTCFDGDIKECVCPCGDSVIKSINIDPFIIQCKAEASVFVTINIDPKETSDVPNLIDIYHDHQEFLKLIGESTYNLLKAASMMDKTNSVEDFVEFLYKNGYKIVKDDKEK